MKIIKRNGSEATFDSEKIVAAITKANNSEEGTRLSPEQIHDIADYVEYKCNKIGRAVSVEEVQDMVENQIMATGAFDLAKHYVQYRYQRSLIRKSNTTDTRILSLIECNNEEVKQENSNKNPTVNSVQRDYMAGEVSRDLTQRLLLPSDIVEADQKGLIHFHDSDYFAQHMHNCDLVNLEDMLQNGTVISETKIEKPHSFSTACNIATQIIAQVASNQYGGQSISLAHLAPFVQVSREKIRTEVAEEMKILNTQATPEQLNDIVETRLHREITKGVQTIQYQIITLMTTNGQAPFLTVFMYLNEAKNAQEKKDLALIIEETLKQRYQGVKNEAGVWITPAFPKLIYVLEDDNVEEDSEYFYLTQLAAKCTARRLVPDYISEKKMKELKDMKDDMETYQNLVTQMEDMETMIEMGYEENDPALIPEIQEMLDEFQKNFDSIRVKTLLSGEYDSENAIIKLNAGAGGTEACDWCGMLYRMYSRWVDRKGFTMEVLDYLDGDEAGIKSVTFQVNGTNAYGYLKSEKGVHRLVRISPFNAAGKRQTSFVSCDVMPDIEEDVDVEIKDDDLRIDTYRSSGAGGQHINKTDSAIRITHLPTGIVVQCQNERSQHKNKDQAMKMLKTKLYLLKQQQHLEKLSDIRGDVGDNGWGNQIRSYVLQPYTMVKDHRTNEESGNVDAVMDGDIDRFINAYLKWIALGNKKNS